jgi:catechol 2,3-dioxygenase-like lactoylglutathione lyase family enzyme
MPLQLRRDNGRLLPDRQIFRATSINHLAYGATDYARTRDWFCDMFGMTVTYDDGVRCSVAWGNPCHELYINKRDDAPGINHWAFGIADFDAAAVKAVLDRHGVKNVRYDGDWAWHTDDPNGIVTQICAEVGCFPGAGPGKPRPESWLPAADTLVRPSKTGWVATAMNHISYRVPKYEETRDHYMDLLGMKLVFEDGTRCALRFGDPPNDLYIGKGDGPAVIDHIAISIADFDLKKVEEDIKKLGIEYSEDGDSAWTIKDPDGYRVQVCAETGVYPGAARDFFHQIKK